MSKMISSTTTIQVVLSSAITTNQLPCTASWMDQGGLGGDSTANTNSTTAVTLVTAPAASVERLVTDLSICNTDTANATVTINKVVSGTPSEWAKFLLPPGYRASYDGHWRVMDPSGNFCETVTVTSGTLTVNQGTSPWTIQGDSASGAANAGNPVKLGAVFNTTQPTVTAGQTVDAQATARGAQIVATGVDTFNVTVNAALPAGSAAIGTVGVTSLPAIPTGANVIGAVTQSSTWTVQPGNTANTTPWLVTANAGTGNFATNNAQWGGVALGAPSNYGTSPGAVEVPGVNAFVTNPVAVTGTFWQATQPVSGVVQAVNAANVFSASFLTTRTVAVTSSHTITGIQISTSGIVGSGTCTVNVQAGTTPFATILSINLAPTSTASSSMIIDLTDLNITAATGFSIIATNTFVTSGYINCAILYN